MRRPRDVTLSGDGFRTHAGDGARAGDTRACAPAARRSARSTGVPIRARATAELAPGRRRGLPAHGERRRLQRPARVPAGQADAPRRRARVRPHGGRRARGGRAVARRHQRLSAPTPSRRDCSPPTPTRSGWRRRARACTATPPSSTSGRPAAYAWLAANAPRFGFVSATRGSRGTSASRRNAGSSSVGLRRPRRRRPRHAALSSRSCPPRFAPLIIRAAQRWSVSAHLLAAQLYAESNFNPFARSPAGRGGDRPVHARHGRRDRPADPFDPAAAIDAQAHLMRDLLRPVRLGAARAGRLQRRRRAPWPRCGCIPPFRRRAPTSARILGLLGGAGDLSPAGSRCGSSGDGAQAGAAQSTARLRSSAARRRL